MTRNENDCYDRPLADQRDNYSIKASTIPNLSATYGSVSLDVTIMNPQRHNEASILVIRGDSKFSSETGDGIHKNGDVDSDYYCWTWKEYFASWRFVELVMCVLPFLATGIYFEVALLIPKMRPIPFQRVYTNDGTNGGISSNGDDAWGYESYTNVVWNPVNTEESLGETISHREYQVLTGLCPWLLQLVLVWFLAPRKRNIRGIVNNFHRWDALHRTTCMYFVGIGLTDVIANCVKYYVGYLRPEFLDICQPYYNETESTFHCADEDFSTINARVSFPSNHSGWSFCGLMLLSMYLERRFGLSSIQSNGANVFETATSTTTNNKKEKLLLRRDRQALYRLISLVCYSPMLFAFFVAASRVVDNKHFPADVVGGAVLGGSVASLIFGIWFPKFNGV